VALHQDDIAHIGPNSHDGRTLAHCPRIVLCITQHIVTCLIAVYSPGLVGTTNMNSATSLALGYSSANRHRDGIGGWGFTYEYHSLENFCTVLR